jgi:hypothetical protein
MRIALVLLVVLVLAGCGVVKTWKPVAVVPSTAGDRYLTLTGGEVKVVLQAPRQGKTGPVTVRLSRVDIVSVLPDAPLIDIGRVKAGERYTSRIVTLPAGEYRVRVVSLWEAPAYTVEIFEKK